MTLKFQCELAEVLVRTGLCYGEELWAWSGGQEVERVDCNCLRRACGIGGRVAEAAVRWLCGRLPLQADSWKAAYRFWIKLCEMGESRLDRKALVAAWRLHKEHAIGWIHDMLKVFLRIGFVSSWEEADGVEEWTGQIARRRRGQFETLVDQHWAGKLRTRLEEPGSKYGFLLALRPTFGSADFCEVSWPWALRRALLRFLVSDHQLLVETGRYFRPPLPREERICQACLAQGRKAVEDEQHVLDHCVAFTDLRAEFWRQVCQEHVDGAWCHRGIMTLMAGIDEMELRARRQVWHSLAVFVQAVAWAKAEQEELEEDGPDEQELLV